MPGVRLILALHNHQPVGSLDGVFEASYRDSYSPFLEVMEDYPDIPFVLHISGSLLEWLIDNQPKYVARVRMLAESGRVEILGGGFFEPILTMIPYRDRVGQVVEYSAYLEERLGVRPRGAWIAERVWEQHLVSALVEAGIEYTVLDDYHFERAGVPENELRGYFLTEEDGHLLKVFPISDRLRTRIPSQEPHETYLELKAIADQRPGSVMVFAEDGEKLGSCPGTYQHVYADGWLRRFCDMIVANREWLEPTTFAQAVDSTLPVAKVYLPDSSHRRMSEWVLASSRLGPTSLAGGSWRNFKARYAESDEMYARMLGLSNRLADLARSETADPDYLELARDALYRAQCNDSYWHGASGGLYAPRLRDATYRNLVGVHNALDEAEGRVEPRVSIDVADFNLDARQEVRLENDRLIAFVRPAQGGHVYELDVRHCSTNVLATLDRRPEADHATIPAERLDYDRTPRKALVDHFLPLDATLDDLQACREVERGDFATGTYLSKVHRASNSVALIMERPGLADGHPIQIRKSISMEADSGTLEVHYVLEGLPVGVPLHFAVEINLAGLAGHADDCYYADPDGQRLGMLDARLDSKAVEGVGLTDERLDLAIGLRWSEPSGLWCFPIETASPIEGGFEGVYQSSAVVPHWRVVADESRRWEVRIRWSLEPARLDETSTLGDKTGQKWSMIDGR